jgi:hypothetical protein
MKAPSVAAFLLATTACTTGSSEVPYHVPLPPTGPSSSAPSASSLPLTITDISPVRGLAGDHLVINGSGFVAGVNVSLGDTRATVNGFSNTRLTITPSPHGAGSVDVVVTNADKASAKLAAGFTYDSISLTSSQSSVTPGTPLQVSWEATTGRPKLDWIGLGKVGDSNVNYDKGWWEYTNGAAAGMLTLPAPRDAGVYEFRYLVNDGYVDVARAGPVTVTAAP